MSLDSIVVRWALVLSVAVLLQVTVVSRLSVFGVHPDLILLVAVVAGLAGGPPRGAIVGFVAGCCADAYLSSRFGVSALAFTLTGYAAGFAGDAVVRPATPIWMGLAGGLSALGVFLYAALGHLLGASTLADPNLLAIIGIVSVVNALLVVPAMSVARWADQDGSTVRIR